MIPTDPTSPPDDPPAPAPGGGENGSNGSNGAGFHHEPEPEPEPEPLNAPPPQVAELVAACMRFVASKYKVALDGTPDTLSLVDQYIREARTAFEARPESIDLVAPAVGAYLGEVMRQEFGAEWFADGSHESWRLYFNHVYLAFNPVGIAREAITMKEEEGWNAHLTLDPAEREAIEERLGVMPEVDEDEYYLPTTRFDVITVVVETLRARAEASGTGDVTFTREDYD
jgi:hypothetical protein